MDANMKQKLEEDVLFVRQAVEQRERGQYRSVGISVVWAVIISVGYGLNDFYVDASALFWSVAPLLGFLLSLWLGARSAKERGVLSRRLGAKHALHWGSIFVAGVAVLSIAVSHGFDGWVISQFFALICGAVLFLGGLHLDRLTLWPGILLILGSAAVDYIEPYPWTTVGLATAASLVASTIGMKPKDDKATATR